MTTSTRYTISNNGVAEVWRAGDWVYKKQPKFLTDNAIWCYRQLYPSGYVPLAQQVAVDTIRVEYIDNEPISNVDEFMSHLPKVLMALLKAGIRHGDLTSYALRIKNNKPYLIDFAESRLIFDPRPDKRREGDEYWLTRTMKELCGIQEA